MSSLGESSYFSDENALPLLEVLSHEKNDTVILFQDLRISNGEKDILVKRKAETIGSSVSVQYNFVREEYNTTPSKEDRFQFDASPKRAMDNAFFRKLIAGLRLNEVCKEYEETKVDFCQQIAKFKNAINTSIDNEKIKKHIFEELGMTLLESVEKLVNFESKHSRDVVLSGIDSKDKLKQLLNLYKSHFKFYYVVEEKLLACINDFVLNIKQQYNLQNYQVIVYIAENIVPKFIQMKKARIHMLQQLSIVNETVNSSSLNERYLYSDLLHKIILDCEDINMKSYKLRLFHNDLKELKDFLLEEMPDFESDSDKCTYGTDIYDPTDTTEIKRLVNLQDMIVDLENNLMKVETIVEEPEDEINNSNLELDDLSALTKIADLLKDHDSIMTNSYNILNDKMNALQTKLNKCEDNVLNCFIKINNNLQKEIQNQSTTELDTTIPDTEEEFKALESKLKDLKREFTTVKKELSQNKIKIKNSMSCNNSCNNIHELTVEELEEEIEKLKSTLFSYDELVKENTQLEQKFCEQKKLIGPYKKQLEQYKIERSELMMETEKNKQVLDDKHHILADVIGHQNKNQKIRHVHTLLRKHHELKGENENLLKKCSEHDKVIEELKQQLKQSTNVDVQILLNTPSPFRKQRQSLTPPVWKLTIPNSPLDKYEAPKTENAQNTDITSPVSSKPMRRSQSTRIQSIDALISPHKVNIRELLDTSYNESISTVQIRI